jgi:HEAT repeat protein
MNHLLKGSDTGPAARWNVHFRRLGGAVLLAVCLAGWCGAQPFREDPVEKFKQALKLEVSKSPQYKERLKGDRLELALKFRQKNLEEAARNLKTPAEISQALLLLEWPSLPRRGERGLKTGGLSDLDRRALSNFEQRSVKIEQKVRQDLTKRFVDETGEGLKSGSPAIQEALSNLVGDTVIAAEQFESGLETDVADLVGPLAKLIQTTDNNDVKAAAARALGTFPDKTDSLIGALRRILADPEANNRKARLAAAEALGGLVQSLTGEETIRASEPGVAMRTIPRGAGSRPTPSMKALSAVAAAITPVAMMGTKDPAPAVRRACLSAVRRVAAALGNQVNQMTKDVVADDLDRLLFDFPQRGTPPKEREWTEGEKSSAEQARELLSAELEKLKPALSAFSKPDVLQGLLRTVRDPDGETRVEARKTMDELARFRRFLQEFNAALPSKNSATKAGGEGKAPTRPGKRKKVARAERDKILLVSGRGEEGLRLPPPPVVDSTGAVPVKRPARLFPAPPTSATKTDAEKLGATLLDLTEDIVGKGLKDPNSEARRATVEAIETLGLAGARFIPQLIGALGDKDLFVRWISARTLGELAQLRTKAQRGEDAETVVPALAKRLDDDDLDVKLAAYTALSQYGADAIEAIPALIEHLTKGDAELRIADMRTLEAIGVDSSKSYARKERPAVLAALRAALPALAQSLRQVDPRIRATAARLMGKYGLAAKPYIPALQRLTTDPDLGSRTAATNAIIEILADR